MSDNTTTLDLKIAEGHYIETEDKIYKIVEIGKDDTIVARRYESETRDYTPEEFSRILTFSSEIKIRKTWK